MADAVRIERARAPTGMRTDVERWTGAFPGVISWVEALYESRKEAA